jgi:transposase-like protein
MTTKVKKPTKKVVPVKVKKVVKESGDTMLMKKTISNLTDVVTQLQNDVKKIKIRMGI